MYLHTCKIGLQPPTVAVGLKSFKKIADKSLHLGGLTPL